ncbi:MAG: hypothetical protein NWF06_02280 [Candidatus Bathyarchaeota archaeon]|nr:hypothetical protein [Candidatus Bathyarchaeum sp.]
MATQFAALIMDTLLEQTGLEDIILSIISFVIIFAIMTVIFYVSGNAVVGRKRVSLKDAFSISVLGTLVLIVCLSVFSLELALLMSVIAWLLLVKYYYETGFVGAFAVGITSAFVSLVVLEVLSWVLGIPLVFDWLSVFVMG